MKRPAYAAREIVKVEVENGTSLFRKRRSLFLPSSAYARMATSVGRTDGQKHLLEKPAPGADSAVGRIRTSVGRWHPAQFASSARSRFVF
jgi:hypothetical protein